MNNLRNAFVGRHKESNALSAALDEAISGKRQVVMLGGEPGIGKTRLALEFSTIAQRRNIEVLWGRCHEQQGMPPYWPWTQIVRTHSNSIEDGQLGSEIGNGAAYIAQILPELSERIDVSENLPVLEPDQSRFLLFDSITALLRNASLNKPLVLILENLHWAGRPSLLLLEFLAQELEDARLLILGVYRDNGLSIEHPLFQTMGELTRYQHFSRISLEGFNQGDVHEFIEASSEISPSSKLVQAVLDRTEGNPLFVSEVVRVLMQKVTSKADEGLDVDIENLGIPDGIREAMSRRLAGLPDQCRHILTVASVIGREFGIDQLHCAVRDISREHIVEALDEAISSGIIEEDDNSVGRYQFTHALMRETVLHSIAAGRRAQMHSEIGASLEQLYSADIESHAAELAYHFYESEPISGTDKLVRYSIMAGERALATYAWEEAINHFSRGLAAKEGHSMDVDTAELLFGLARAQHPNLERHQLHQPVDTLMPAFEYYVEKGDVANALAIAAYPVHGVFGYRGTYPLLSKALDLVTDDSQYAGKIISRYARSLVAEMGDAEGAIEAFNRALVIAQRESDSILEIDILNGLSEAYFYDSRFHESLEFGLRAIDMARRPGVSVETQHRVSIYTIDDLVVTGDLDGARRLADPLLSHPEEPSGRYNLARDSFFNAMVAGAEGNWMKARHLSDQGLAASSQDVRLLNNRAILEFQAGDFDQGRIYVGKMLETMQSSVPGPAMEYHIVPVVVGIVSRISGITEWDDIAEEAASIVISSPLCTRFTEQQARAGLALMAVERNDIKVASEQYLKLETFPRFMECYGYYSLDRILGLLAHFLGRLDAATNHFEGALDLCRQGGYLPELAWTCYDYADILFERKHPSDHDKAVSLLEESLSITTETGMRPLRERVTTLQEQAESVHAITDKYPAGLTERQVEVLQLIAQGNTNVEIAQELVLSERTVQRHIANIYAKISARNRVEATAFALNNLDRP